MEENKSNAPAVTQQWLDGISYETAFWNNVYRWPHTFKGMMGWSNYGSVIDLEGFDANSFLTGQRDPKVYDVGAGMSYAVGSFIDKGDGGLTPLDIHYLDPLAHHFNHILKKYKKRLPPIELGMAEFLSAFIPQGEASLITIQNALDHSANPMKGIVEALVSLRQGGVLYLNHHPNEAEMEKYKGFHQYNIDEKDGELVIWNPAVSLNVSRLLHGYAKVETQRMDNGHIIAVITKGSEADKLPQHLQRYADDKQSLNELCQALLQYQYAHSSFTKNLKERLDASLFNAIQFMAQMLPWSVKMKIKHFIKQA